MKNVQVPITAAFKEICKEIIDINLSQGEWAGVESSDMFQTDTFSGGFDATENAFAFSYYNGDKEYWFQLTLDKVGKIHQGQSLVLRGTLADVLM